jgi:hypothetical protein
MIECRLWNGTARDMSSSVPCSRCWCWGVPPICMYEDKAVSAYLYVLRGFATLIRSACYALSSCTGLYGVGVP